MQPILHPTSAKSSSPTNSILYEEILTKDFFLHIIYLMTPHHIAKSRAKSRQLAKLLVQHGYRLFSVNDVRKVIDMEKLPIKDVGSSLNTLIKQGWIQPIRRNLYALDTALLGGLPIHEYEIATSLVRPSALSHFTAFHVHELTDQLPHIVFVSAPTGTSLPRCPKENKCTFAGVQVQFINVRKNHFFGIDHIWRGESQIPVTDLEKTLLDGLVKPNYCGGFMEVMHAYTTREFDLEKIIRYALKLDKSVTKRLGWVLEKTEHHTSYSKILQSVPVTSYVKLDPTLPKKGTYNKKWNIVENL